jgi:hypothetical protein
MISGSVLCNVCSVSILALYSEMPVLYLGSVLCDVCIVSILALCSVMSVL